MVFLFFDIFKTIIHLKIFIIIILERQAFENDMKYNSTAVQITIENINNFKDQLFALPHFGADLKELYDATVESDATN